MSFNRGVIRVTETSKMELFAQIVNTIINCYPFSQKSSISDAPVVLTTPLFNYTSFFLTGQVSVE